MKGGHQVDAQVRGVRQVDAQVRGGGRQVDTQARGGGERRRGNTQTSKFSFTADTTVRQNVAYT